MQRGFAPIIVLISVVLIVILAGGYFFWQHKNGVFWPSEPKACTADAKICPDGSSVGRTGPNCEFTACPSSESSSADTIDWKTFEGQTYSLKYPPNWAQRKTGGEGCGPVIAPTDNSYNGWLTICGPYVNPSETPENLANMASGGQKVLLNKKITIEGFTGMEVQYQTAEDQSEFDAFVGKATIPIETGGLSEQRSGPLGFYLFTHDNSQKEMAGKLFGQILSTIKFN